MTTGPVRTATAGHGRAPFVPRPRAPFVPRPFHTPPAIPHLSNIAALVTNYHYLLPRPAQTTRRACPRSTPKTAAELTNRTNSRPTLTLVCITPAREERPAMTNSTRCGALTTVGGRPCRQRTSDETPCKYHGPGTQYAADRARADAAATHAGEARAARLALAPPTPPLPPRTTVNHDPTAPPPERRRDEVWPPIKCEHPLCRATARPGRYTCARHRDDQAALR